MAGVADDERLRIMERTATGIKRAKEGLPWTGHNARPVGRDWDKEKHQWSSPTRAWLLRGS